MKCLSTTEKIHHSRGVEISTSSKHEIVLSTIIKFLMHMLTLEQHGGDLTAEVQGFGVLACPMRPRPSG